ncbi:MAG: shikimate dehydrogenase [Emergencia sp.]|nr:shikimate dehydrogenase [Emergencia sp.]
MKFGSIGANMKYSYSKLIHEALGYPWNLWSLNEAELRKRLEKRDFDGASVTIPYKQLVMEYCDYLTPLAKDIGAVNVLYFDKEKRLCGSNTDYTGFLYAMDRAGIEIKGKKAVILGNGATCQTIKKALKDRGSASLIVASRKGAQGQEEEKDGISCTIVDYRKLLEQHTDADLIINASPVGMQPDTEKKLVNLEDFPGCSGVFDVIYNPPQSALIRQAVSLGIPASGGIPMLVAQGTAAAELLMDKPGYYEKENERLIEMLRKEVEVK